ncbi:hypothetical protein [Deinococcus roseus]|uniref:Uncharacterized protein n=1 Tax=Deinococcus roseus TaxID=392414 RepID=A0ABQ2CWV7_9DEIO|nr:hypothetical protein [Deinococcus roseus]GGJ27554.1 hypothetical protein GCM10008938_12080 [Deinococcus roseus]
MNMYQVTLSEIWQMLPWWQWVLGAALAIPFTWLVGYVLRGVFPYWLEDQPQTQSHG